MEADSAGDAVSAATLFAAAPADPMPRTAASAQIVSASMDDVGMGSGAGTAAVMEGIHASIAGLDALFVEDAALATGANAATDVDVWQRQYEIRLERMSVVKQLEAQLAAVKARDAAEAVEIQHAMTPPEAPVHERTFTEMSAIEEIAGVLTVSSGAAGALVTQARQLTSLPLAMEALSAGSISWMQAKIIADETEGLGSAGAAALVEHVLDPNPVRGAAAGELVPSRFRSRVRGWRERHHPESFEKRHTKCAADRRMEYTPDRDGMAWLSLYLPADQASAIWNRATALARGLQGPEEPRTMTQLRPDIAAHLLLSPALSPAPESTAADFSTEENTDAPLGVASVSVMDRPDDAAGTGATDDGASTGSTGHEATNTVHLASAGHEETDRSAYTDLANVPVPKVDVLVTVPVFALLAPHRRTRRPRRPRSHPRLHGPQTRRRWRQLLLPGARRPARRCTAGNRPHQLPPHQSHEKGTTVQGRQMHLPRLQQPVLGQRHGPPHRLATRRDHRDQQPGPTLPKTPPPQTQQALDTHTGHKSRTTRLDLTHRPALQIRTTRQGTATMATWLSAWPNTRGSGRGDARSQARGKEPPGSCTCGPANRLRRPMGRFRQAQPTSPDDPPGGGSLWDDAAPPKLPKDPLKEWEWDMVNS
ncbi:hypothetical protein RKD54_002563 [Pseudarthrobacter sp. SLBN-100]